MPILAVLLSMTPYQKWQQWSSLQKQFLEDAGRKKLRQSVQNPLSVKN